MQKGGKKKGKERHQGFVESFVYCDMYFIETFSNVQNAWLTSSSYRAGIPRSTQLQALAAFPGASAPQPGREVFGPRSSSSPGEGERPAAQCHLP